MKEIAIFGAGGFGREVQMLIEQINQSKPEWQFVGYYDDTATSGTQVNGHRVLGSLEDLNKVDRELWLVVAVGNPVGKKKIHDKLSNEKLRFAVLIHPSALIGSADYNTIGEGSIITAGNIITVNTNIGKHVILNLGCTVGHDTIIDDYCSFMPAVNISGEVHIHKGVYVGTGAKIINQLEIGENTVVGAGAVVSKSLPPNCTAVGIPAKPIKFHQ